MAMAVLLLFRAVAQEGHSLRLRELLDQPKRKFLAMIFDGAVPAIDCRRFEQFLAVTCAELAPGDLTFLKAAQKLFARAKVRHPDMVAVSRKTAPTIARHQQAQPIFSRLDWRV